LRQGIDDDHIEVALDLAHLLAADNLAENPVLGDDTLDTGTTSDLLGQFANACVLQEVGEFLLAE